MSSPHLKPLKIAHRGLRCLDQSNSHLYFPENTLGAFQNALDSGFDGIEFDVHISSDRVPFVFHDDNLKRLCQIQKPIHHTHSQELAELTIQSSSQKIPLLRELLDKFHQKFLLYLEIKIPDTEWNHSEFINIQIDSILDVLKPYLSSYQGWIGSFHPQVVQRIYDLHPSLALCICETQQDFDSAYPIYGSNIPYSLSFQNLKHLKAPIHKMYWDLPFKKPNIEECLAWVMDQDFDE